MRLRAIMVIVLIGVLFSPTRTNRKLKKFLFVLAILAFSLISPNLNTDPILLNAGATYNYYQDFAVDADSDIDTIANIGSSSTSYLDARTVNSVNQEINEGEGGDYIPGANDENDIDGSSNIDGFSNIGTQGVFSNSQGTSADSAFMDLQEAEGSGYSPVVNTEDYMDNVTDTQVPGDIGTYSDWTEMQDSDLVNNTLSEENVLASTLDEDHYDSNAYDIDSNADFVTETNPSQANDSINSQYMNIQESYIEVGGIGVGSTTNEIASSSTFSFSHDGGSATNKLLIVRISTHNAIDISGTVTYGGQSMTEILNINYLTELRVMAFYLIAPVAGINTLSGSFTAETNCIISATNVYGVDQTTPIDNLTNQTGSTSATTSTSYVSSEIGDLVMDVFAYRGNVAPTAGSGQTAQFITLHGNVYSGGSSNKSISTNTSMSWSNLQSPPRYYAHIAWNINVAAVSHYALDVEYAWTAADYNDDNEELIINVETASQGGETLNVWEWTGSGWALLGNIGTNGNNTFTLTYLLSSTYYIKLNDTYQTSDGTQDAWNIDLITLKTSSGDYEFDRQFGFINVDYDDIDGEELAIRTGTIETESLDIYVWDGSWVKIGTITDTDDNMWFNISISAYLTGSSITFRFKDVETSSDSDHNTWQIDSVLIHTWSYEIHDYVLDFEYRWISADASQTYEEISIWMGTRSDTENLIVDFWDGDSWELIGIINGASTHFNFSVTVTTNTYIIRFTGSEAEDTIQSDWEIDLITLHTWTYEDIDYELEWEHQAQNVDLNRDTFNITIYGYSNENIRIQTWDIGGSTWNALSPLVIGSTEQWYNYTVDSNAVGETITWRYLDTIKSSDNILSTLRIDYAGIAGWNHSITLIETKNPVINYEPTVYHGDKDFLTGVWNDTDDNPLEDADVQLELLNNDSEVIFSDNYSSATNVSGSFEITLNYSRILPGDYTWNLTMTKYPYTPSNITFDVTILPKLTEDPILTYNSIVYFGDEDTLSGTWDSADDKPIENATINLEFVNNNSQVVYSAQYINHTDPTGYFEIPVDYSQIIPGDYAWSITLDKIGHRTANALYGVTILPMPTIDPNLSYSPVVYHSTTDTLTGIWNDTDNGLISDADVQLVLRNSVSNEIYSENYTSITDDNGLFEIDLTYSDVLPGNYTWELILSKVGFIPVNILFNVTVLPMITNNPVIDYSNTITVRDTDLISGTWEDINQQTISNAEILLILLDSNLQPVTGMEFQSSTNTQGHFETTVHYDDILPGNYSWSITLNKTGYVTSTISIDIEIQPINVELSIQMDSVLTQNEVYRIHTNVISIGDAQSSLMLNGFGEPMVGVEVILEISVILTNSSQSIITLSKNTNSFGIANFALSSEQTSTIKEITGVSASIDDPYIAETTVEVSENELPEVQENIINPTDNTVQENASDLLTLVLVIVSVISLTLISLRLISGRRGSGELERQLLEFYFIRNIQLLLIKNLNGLPVFEKKFSQLETDPTLLAGLSHALSMFIDEVSKGGGQVEYLERGDFSLISVRGTNTIMTIVSGSGFPKRFNDQIVEACTQIEADVFPNVSDQITMISSSDDKAIFEIFDYHGIPIGLLDKLMIDTEKLAKATNGFSSSPAFEILSSYSEYEFFQLGRLIDGIEAIGTSQEEMAKIILEAYASKIITPYVPESEL